MRIIGRNIPISASLSAAAILGAMACADAPVSVEDAASHAALHESAQSAAKKGGASASTEKMVKSLHSATARYHSTVQSTKAGYVESSPCIAAPGLGGMGFHWVNQNMVDPVFDPTTPEAVLYAPDGNGKLKKVAVEFIVINVGQPAPMFGDYPFDVGGAPIPVPHWTLHVWVDQDNPSGVFAPFNPTVSCPS